MCVMYQPDALNIAVTVGDLFLFISMMRWGYRHLQGGRLKSKIKLQCNCKTYVMYRLTGRDTRPNGSHAES